MATPRDVLTPDSLSMLQAVAKAGSFAAAARDLGLVPSALTYRIRAIEDALDVLLFDRSSRQARITPAGEELLRESRRLLDDLDNVANRVKRVATGWEPQLTLSVDGVISRLVMMELADAFFALDPPTRLRIREETLSGTQEALTSGLADLAIGIAAEPLLTSLMIKPLGSMSFVFAVAPHHPLATAPEPLTDDVIRQHRAVAVADSVQRGGGVTVGLLGGQDVFTVPTMTAKLEAQLRGLGAGHVPEPMARPFIETGRLVVRQTRRQTRIGRMSYAWRTPGASGMGRALQWWLQQLESPKTRTALLERHHGV
ncbi:LysR substrate-binding domain-containing protein [Variovorax sp. VNK109]|jgi:DNA-binding transcriptional LysR family regulator|uniref:LysR substrate-binding domain-containing protein n=1 Tax=Variovorax sp. VNK109 TaxID=3400919 RepID=UPI003C0F1D02